MCRLAGCRWSTVITDSGTVTPAGVVGRWAPRGALVRRPFKSGRGACPLPRQRGLRNSMEAVFAVGFKDQAHGEQPAGLWHLPTGENPGLKRAPLLLDQHRAAAPGRNRNNNHHHPKNIDIKRGRGRRRLPLQWDRFHSRRNFSR